MKPINLAKYFLFAVYRLYAINEGEKMLSAVSSNINFKGNVVIGNMGEKQRQGKANVAKSINTLGKNSNEQCEKFMVNMLNDFAEDLASSTDPCKDLDIRLFYNEGYISSPKHAVNDKLNLTIRDYDSDDAVIIEKDLGGIGASKDKPIVRGEELMNRIADLFNEARRETFEQLGLDGDKIKENKHINKILDMLA